MVYEAAAEDIVLEEGEEVIAGEREDDSWLGGCF